MSDLVKLKSHFLYIKITYFQLSFGIIALFTEIHNAPQYRFITAPSPLEEKIPLLNCYEGGIITNSILGKGFRYEQIKNGVIMEMSTVSLSLPTDVYQQLQSVATDERISPIKLIELLLREQRHQQYDKTKRRSVIEILAAAPGHQIFQSAEQVNTYLAEEKDAWDN